MVKAGHSFGWDNVKSYDNWVATKDDADKAEEMISKIPDWSGFETYWKSGLPTSQRHAKDVGRVSYAAGYIKAMDEAKELIKSQDMASCAWRAVIVYVLGAIVQLAKGINMMIHPKEPVPYPLQITLYADGSGKLEMYGLDGDARLFENIKELAAIIDDHEKYLDKR